MAETPGVLLVKMVTFRNDHEDNRFLLFVAVTPHGFDALNSLAEAARSAVEDHGSEFDLVRRHGGVFQRYVYPLGIDPDYREKEVSAMFHWEYDREPTPEELEDFDIEDPMWAEGGDLFERLRKDVPEWADDRSWADMVQEVLCLNPYGPKDPQPWHLVYRMTLKDGSQEDMMPLYARDLWEAL